MALFRQLIALIKTYDFPFVTYQAMLFLYKASLTFLLKGRIALNLYPSHFFQKRIAECVVTPEPFACVLRFLLAASLGLCISAVRRILVEQLP